MSLIMSDRTPIHTIETIFEPIPSPEYITPQERLFFEMMEIQAGRNRACPSMYMKFTTNSKNGGFLFQTDTTELERSTDRAYGGTDKVAARRAQITASELYLQSVGASNELSNPGPDTVRDFKPAIDETYVFLPELFNLGAVNTPPALCEEDLNSEAIKAKILTDLASVKGKIANGEQLYTPYLLEGTQLTATGYYQELAHMVETNIDLLILKSPIPYLFSTSEFNRGRLLPSCIPVSTEKGDVETGYCDRLNNTNFILGETAWIVAQYKDFAYTLGKNARGWVYLGGENTENRYISPEYYDAEFPISIFTPKELINYVWKPKIYAHAVSDCSSLAKRALIRMGLRVSPYSGDLFDDLEAAGLKPQFYSTPEELDELSTQGVYFIQLMAPTKTEGVYSSAHLYIAAIDNTRELKAISLVFNTRDGNGNMVYPIGSHVSNRAEFEGQLNRGRRLKFVKIAGIKNE